MSILSLHGYQDKSPLKLRLLVSIFREVERQEVQKQLESPERPKAMELPPHFFGNSRTNAIVDRKFGWFIVYPKATVGASTTTLRVPFAVSTVHWNMNKYNRIITGIKAGDIKNLILANRYSKTGLAPPSRSQACCTEIESKSIFDKAIIACLE